MATALKNAAALRAALYVRLSKEDESEGPSQSVENQLAMLNAYCREQGLSVFDHYIDDGWSGTNFDRPAFQRMLADIEAGSVNLVITKDLSRLGRDYIGTGHYMERWFPEHRVRYISLLDGIDTGVESSANDLTPFRAIMNDMYAKDISKKISSVKHDRQRRGLFIGGRAPYGYRLSESEKGRLLVDETAAAVVRRCFTLALCGKSCRQIAQRLNAENIPSPAVYAGLPRQGRGLWSGEAVTALLRNEVYAGCMVQARSRRVSYKSKKCVRQARENWIVVPGTHRAIVSRECFDAVARLLDARSATRDRRHPFLLQGLLFCADCGAPLGVIARGNAAGGETLYHICRAYQRGGETRPCSAHNAREDEVRASALAALAALCAPYLTQSFLLPAAAQACADARQNALMEGTPMALQTRLHALTRHMDRAYADHLDGLLSVGDFKRIYEKLRCERQQLERALAEPSGSPEIPDASALCDEFIQSALTGALLFSLLERAELSEARTLTLRLRCRAPAGGYEKAPVPD